MQHTFFSFFLAAILLGLMVLPGCNSRQDAQVGNYEYEFDPKIVPQSYSFVPDYESSIYYNHSTGKLDLGNCDGGCSNGLQGLDGRGAVVLIGVIFSAVIILYSADVIAHQFDSTDYYLNVTNSDQKVVYKLQAGHNKLAFTDQIADQIREKRSQITIRAVGKHSGMKGFQANLDGLKLTLKD